MTRSHCLSVITGLALGLASFGCTASPTTTKPEPEPAGPPQVGIRGEKSISAGDVDYAVPRKFPFTVVNSGGTPLELTLTHKSCSCAEVEMPAGPIAPGADAKIVIKWAPIPGNAGPYTLFADLDTNDPKVKSLRLTVNALIRPLVRVFVDGKENNSWVDFGDEPIPPGDAKLREVKVFSTKLEKFDIDASCTLPGFDIKTTPLDRGSPVDSARCGYSIELKTTDKLPLGYVRTELNITLRNLGSEPDRTIHVPVYAVIGNGIFTVRPSLFLFTKPKISDEDTAKVIVTFIVKADKEGIEVANYEPRFLKVDPPQSLGGGRWLITAHLEPGDPEAAKFQADAPVEGQVVLKVAGLDRPVPVRVKWNPLPK